MVRPENAVHQAESVDGHKRADYILERGMWKAVCRDCRFIVEHPDRQRASILFRGHRREILNAAPSAPIVDLRTETSLATLGPGDGLAQEQNTA